MSKRNRGLSASICIFIFLIFCAVCLNRTTRKVAAENSFSAIETAIYTRQEFFGSQAIVPLPTAEARENLARLSGNSPDDLYILAKLAEIDEKLSRFDEAEKCLLHLAEIDKAKLENLAAFYERRGQFEKQAETLEKIMFSADADKRAAMFEILINAARRHDLKQYLQTDFYAKVVSENADVYPIFERLIDNLSEEKKYDEALIFTRQAKMQFHEKSDELLNREVEILLAQNNSREAEKVFTAAFDPFWSDEQAQEFYGFLSRQDRLRAYGAELKIRFRKNPADFDAAIKLALYRNHDYVYDNDSVAPIIAKLEQVKKDWTTDELVTAARLLIKTGEAESASRFLYTIYLREDFKENSALRAKVLYQLFEMFSDAEQRKLPLVKGDLRFYEDVARSDAKPGIASGILSLIFSDTNPRERLDDQETKANEFFNRTAAYRIFEEYKRENTAASPELAQMYLDTVRLYSATKEPEIAEKTLNEFAGIFENSTDYPQAALMLADAFTIAENEGKAREVLQKTLDYLGKQDKPLAPEREKIAIFGKFSDTPENKYLPNRNEGINIPNEDEKLKANNDYFYEKPNVFHDYLDRENIAVTYAEVLEKLVASFAKEKKTAEILQVYSNEIAKYPNEEWLYEARLARLEQTNLTGEKLELYKTALARFQTNDWRDKLARFFVRENRDADFAAFSTDLIGKLSDADAQNYLSEFIAGKVSAGEFEKRLYLKLYESAHVRFPHNISFVSGLLRFYQANNQTANWQKLAAEYYFESPEIREIFLDELARTSRLREFLAQANGRDGEIYSLFRADAAARLSGFENSAAAYRRLNELYPQTSEFAGRLINFTRSFGQKNRELLNESANAAAARADFDLSSADARTSSGEIYAELGNYERARDEWKKMIATGSGEKEIYLDTATVYWDYFQYDDALRTIENLRVKFHDETLYAFETGAIYEARRDQTKAVGEYVKALDANRDEAQKEKSINRLAALFAREKRDTNENISKSNKIENLINSAFSAQTRKRKDSSFLALGYAEFLEKIKQTNQAEKVLNQAISRNQNAEFLESVQEFYQIQNNDAGEQLVLQRFAATERNPRRTIGFRLQLAESFAENQQRDAAKIVLEKLVRNFPTNFGVLTETSDFFRRLGFESDAARILENALPKSRGAYRVALTGKLAENLIRLDRLDSAVQILFDLHSQDKANIEIFDQLARIYVRANKPKELREAFAETVAEIKKSDTDRREIEQQIADLRTKIIDAFTSLKDYKSAVEQHIEIINREPENEELTENAIAYVERYGDAETLVNYYEKTAAEAFKNYRWNVVLARIYAAKKDDERAVKNYHLAIENQPEMPELYLAVSDLETKRGNYDEALKNIGEVLQITNNDSIYVKKKIEILQRAGRISEIEAEKAKLPAEEKKEIKTDQFAEAQKLQNTEREKSRQIYRTAFENLLENPLSGELKTADISGYAESMRDEIRLDEISGNIWKLREKLISAANASNATDAGEAKKRLSILDGALVESIGATAKNVGTDEELQNLHEDLRRKIEETTVDSDRFQTASLIQDFSRRAGFGDLEELILQKRVETENSPLEKESRLRHLIDFYNERGAYRKSFDALEKYGSGDLRLKADAAKLAGNRAKELDALRIIYWLPADKLTADDEIIEYYLEILYSENRAELQSLTEKSSLRQLHLINFLLGKGEREMAHAAIENSSFPKAWKVSRNAETSLALREFDENSECFFCDALQFAPIGEMVAQTPDKQRFLINDDWFQLTREYGEWLFEKKDREISPSKFLAAMTENLPHSANEQFKLGEFYLAKNELNPAIEHLRLAIEIENLAEDDKEKLTTLGAADYKISKHDEAEKLWAQVLEDESISNAAEFFEILRRNGLSEIGREKIAPLIVKFLQTADAGDSEDFQELIRAAAKSITVEAEKSAYFTSIIQKRPTDISLAAMLINESLIGGNFQDSFYKLLINHAKDSNDDDFNFTSVADRVWNKDDAEAVYDQENEYKTEEPENEKYKWQKKYFEWLVKSGNDAKAAQISSDIEKSLKNRYARPAWLRTAKIRMAIRAGKYDPAEAERLIGIKITEAATTINTPSDERFNDVRQTLKDENRNVEADDLSVSFFARTLALGKYEQSNFSGLARAFFQKNEPEKALNLLRLMIEANDAETQNAAYAEITAMNEIKAHAADAAKIPKPENNLNNISNALENAAQIALEFLHANEAINFRRRLIEVNPTGAANKIELAKILLSKNENAEAENFLTQIVNDKNVPRNLRWQARLMSGAEIPSQNFDAFSQFYQGLIAAKSNQNDSAVNFFIASLIADKDAEIPSRQELIKFYAANNLPFAALRLAETDKAAKLDALLEILSGAAEKIGDFSRAIGFENQKAGLNTERVSFLQNLENAKNKRATDFKVDRENTRKL